MSSECGSVLFCNTTSVVQFCSTAWRLWPGFPDGGKSSNINSLIHIDQNINPLIYVDQGMITYKKMSSTKALSSRHEN